MMGFRLKKHVLIALFLLRGISLFAQKQNLKVIYIGDSITQGVQLSAPATEAPPATASAYLQKQPGTNAILFSNQGHSGFTTVDFLPGGNAFKQIEQAAGGLTDKPGILIFSIMLGTNDSAVKGTNGAPVSPDTYYINLQAIVGHLLKEYPACRVVIQHPIWYSPNTYNGAQYLQEGLDRLQSYFPMMGKLVDSYARTNKDRIFIGDTEAFDYFRKNYLTVLNPENGRQGVFYLHPNKAGAIVLGEFWAKAVYKVINRN